ncbi:MAG: hypothetical protein IIC02_05885, partial [Planctomycetes bacterium]|nr:hypothetical protein [Planctomycetota bacterium]
AGNDHSAIGKGGDPGDRNIGLDGENGAPGRPAFAVQARGPGAIALALASESADDDQTALRIGLDGDGDLLHQKGGRWTAEYPILRPVRIESDA